VIADRPLVRRPARVAAALLLAALVSGCVPPRGGWDVAALEGRHPELARYEGRRLGDATPFLIPRDDALLLFLCRWPRERAIGVSLPEDVSEAERTALRAALAAWQQALALRFEERERPRAQIEIRFVEALSAGGARQPGADTVADCAVASSEVRGGRLDASIVFASIHLRRSHIDLVGRERPLSGAELTGAALHELGHALGFSGHAALGESVMVRDVEAVRAHGRGVLAGEAFADATLEALYALPSGTLLARRPLAAPAAARYAALARRLAGEGGWIGPRVRVGDRAARISWLHASEGAAALRIDALREGLRDPLQLELKPNRAASLRLLP